MAAVEITYTYEDDSGDLATTSVKIPNGFDIVAMGNFAREMALLIDPLLRGGLRKVSICLAQPLPAGVTINPFANSDVEEKGYFRMGTSNNLFSSISLPTFDESFVVPGTDQIDTAQPDVNNLILALENGISVLDAGLNNVVIEPCTISEQDIVQVLSAFETFTKGR